MNWVFFLLILIGYLSCAWRQWNFIPADPESLSPMHILTEHMLTVAGDAVSLAIGLIGVLALFLGLMKIAEDAGLLQILSKLIYPLLKWLFPEIPPNHPAFGAMMMNLSANVLGIGNAATPFGLKAMQELEKLNPHPGTATNAMVLFLAINTSSVTLIPTKVIALRLSAGSHDAAGIIATTLFATLCSTVVAIIAAKVLQRWVSAPPATVTLHTDPNSPAFAQYPRWIGIVVALGVLCLFPITFFWGKALSNWIIPTLMIAIVGFGFSRKVNIYESFTEGAKGGFETALKIIPFLVAILVAIGMFRASGAMKAFSDWIGPYTSLIGLPADAIPMVLMRPLSGSGSLGLLSDLFNDPLIGPDSYTGYLVSTMMGSTETTFYILAVYFGCVQIRRMRHALAAGLIAEAAGMIASIVAVNWLIFS